MIFGLNDRLWGASGLAAKRPNLGHSTGRRRHLKADAGTAAYYSETCWGETRYTTNSGEFERVGRVMKDWELAFHERFELSFSPRHPLTTQILDAHATIEGELDAFSQLVLPRADRLRGMGFGHKASLFAASLNIADAIIDPLVKALSRVNDLRNSVAHNATENEIEQKLSVFIDGLPPAAGENRDFDSSVAFLLGTIVVAANEHLNRSG